MNSSVATVTTTKAPVQQTLAFVRYHLRCGVDHMFLYFDDPQDASIPALRGEAFVTCIPCDRAHWRRHAVEPGSTVQARQMANATDAFRRARESGFEWLVHIDADELLYADDSFPELFARTPPRAEVLVFPTKEALPQRFEYDRPFSEISLFKHDPTGHLLRGDLFMGLFDRKWRGLTVRAWRYKKRVVKRTGCDHPSFLDSFLLGHTHGKAATRTSSRVEKIGNHRPQGGPDRSLPTHFLRRGAVLHYDCMGFEPWCAKWASRLDGLTRFDIQRFRPDRRRVLKMFEAARQTGRAAVRALYNRMYVLSTSEKIVLRTAGFVQRIRLPETVFAPLHPYSDGVTTAHVPDRSSRQRRGGRAATNSALG